MNLDAYLQHDQFLLLLAPPAWGKTSLLLDLYQKYDKSLVFVSPLRALAEEVYQRICKLPGAVLARNFKKNDEALKKKFFLVGTVETLDNGVFESLDTHQTIVVFDEFHLFYQWGEDFRPALRELQFHVSSLSFPILAMTASLSRGQAEMWFREYDSNYKNLFVWNEGNMQFKHPPQNVYYFPYKGKALVDHYFRREILEGRRDESVILFCRYKKEVDYWFDFCHRMGVKAHACVGGEVPRFLKELKKEPRPKCIISTSVLSHGVNLPCFSKVFINYAVKNQSFWLQMCSRAGRRGEGFNVYTLDSYGQSFHSKLQDYLFNFAHLARYFLIRNFGVW